MYGLLGAEGGGERQRWVGAGRAVSPNESERSRNRHVSGSLRAIDRLPSAFYIRIYSPNLSSCPTRTCVRFLPSPTVFAPAQNPENDMTPVQDPNHCEARSLRKHIGQLPLLTFPTPAAQPEPRVIDRIPSRSVRFKHIPIFVLPSPTSCLIIDYCTPRICYDLLMPRRITKDFPPSSQRPLSFDNARCHKLDSEDCFTLRPWVRREHFGKRLQGHWAHSHVSKRTFCSSFFARGTLPLKRGIDTRSRGSPNLVRRASTPTVQSRSAHRAFHSEQTGSFRRGLRSDRAHKACVDDERGAADNRITAGFGAVGPTNALPERFYR